ncbi:unnamed protein product [Cunninghamella blakesleeana]
MSDTAGKVEKKENASSEHINLKVVGSDNNEVFFKIKRSTPLRKLMDAYCDRQGKSAGSVNSYMMVVVYCHQIPQKNWIWKMETALTL